MDVQRPIFDHKCVESDTNMHVNPCHGLCISTRDSRATSVLLNQRQLPSRRLTVV
ncbi:hypothetical protein DPMN_056873 [Dreissena polymorpha]|uniref:Uncharacterized protein n=1 Tax=Dreissena polymorpha TaxID=45954 RepID=A0A9D4CU90_DREPO|nr:hypothetical protein DPMN_056873 [Dreissena polymorpha]